MSTPSPNPTPIGPIRATGRVVLSVLWFLFASTLARHGAHGLVSADWVPLVEQAMLAFLLLFGFGTFGFILDRQLEPITAQGLPLRQGWLSEAGLGLAAGWGLAVVCVLPLLVGGLALHFSLSLVSFGWLLVDAAYFAFATLAIQIAFRGYAFQAALRVLGPLPASLFFSILFALLRAYLPGTNRASVAVSIALGLLLSLAYLRTRALWLPWGLHFGWVASRALLFGLPVNGVSSHSPVIRGDALGAFSLSGADFGLDASWFAFYALLAAFPIVYRLTRELDFVHNAPVLIPAGIPMDLDAAGKRQHEAATRPETPNIPEIKPLVQILPATPPPPPIARDIDRPAQIPPTPQA